MRRMIAVALLLGACAPHRGAGAQSPPQGQAPPVAAPDSTGRGTTRDSTRQASAALRATFGTLSQSDISLRVRGTDMEIRFVPLNERVIQLLAPDAQQSLRGLVASKREAIDALARQNGLSDPGLVLVTFYGQRDGVRFDPQLVTLTGRGRLLRPVGVVPLTARFSSQQLAVREQVSAIYLYEDLVPVDESFTVSYDSLVSDDWERKLPLLERERGRMTPVAQ